MEDDLDLTIPHSIKNNWQRIVGLLADMIDADAGYITKISGEKLKILKVEPEDSVLEEGEIIDLVEVLGKTTIPEEVLTKPGDLTDEEWQMMQEHPKKGFKIASASEEFDVVAEEILAHHERWEGNGYPRGLAGEEIPFLARIISIVDTYDVMTTGRSYKEAMSKEKALKEIKDCACSQFDPELAEEFVKMMR